MLLCPKQYLSSLNQSQGCQVKYGIPLKFEFQINNEFICIRIRNYFPEQISYLHAVLSSLECSFLSALIQPQLPHTFKYIYIFLNLAILDIIYQKHCFAIAYFILLGSENSTLNFFNLHIQPYFFPSKLLHLICLSCSEHNRKMNISHMSIYSSHSCCLTIWVLSPCSSLEFLSRARSYIISPYTLFQYGIDEMLSLVSEPVSNLALLLVQRK